MAFNSTLVNELSTIVMLINPLDNRLQCAVFRLKFSVQHLIFIKYMVQSFLLLFHIFRTLNAEVLKICWNCIIVHCYNYNFTVVRAPLKLGKAYCTRTQAWTQNPTEHIFKLWCLSITEINIALKFGVEKAHVVIGLPTLSVKFETVYRVRCCEGLQTAESVGRVLTMSPCHNIIKRKNGK